MEIRKQKEKDLHNLLRDQELESSKDFKYLTSNLKLYSVVRKSKSFVEKWLINKCPNKRVLDYCCGNGNMSIKIAKMEAAEVVGIDISDISIENAKKYAEKERFSKCVNFLVMDGESMEFKNNYFDIIYESGVLHHLDLQKAYPELARVLKPGGQCICIEALGHNPIISQYRKRTPHLRTEWEAKHILKKKDIEKAKSHFHKVKILGFFHLATIVAVPLRDLPLFNIILNILEIADKMLLKLPILKWQAWQAVFVLSEPKKTNKEKQNNGEAII